ncbi:MAG: HNH endonuclease, partial [Verrucomicrobiota bacterium]
MAAIDGQVLVLNRLWQPVNICGVRRALTLLFTGHAEVVHTDAEKNFYTFDAEGWLAQSENYEGPFAIRTVSQTFRAPTVVVLNTYDKLPK